MSDDTKTYTYRCGEKIALEKSPDEMVVRAMADVLGERDITTTEQVSSASTRVRTSSPQLEGLMNRSRAIAPTHHAYYEADSGAEFLITDRIFVTFRHALSDAEVDAFAARYALVKKTSYSDTEFLFQLTNHTGMNPVKLVVKLTEDEPLVAFAEHDLNQRMSKAAYVDPVDPQYGNQWHLHTRLNHVDFDSRASANCEASWRILDGFGSEAVVVAVSDDGCKLDHHDFDSADKFANWGYFRGERLVRAGDIDADPNAMYIPGANHGTSCCGVIAGEVDAMLTVGAAAGCRLLPIQWQSAGPSLFISDSKLLTALDFIADKADVMSNSWGGVPTSLWALPVLKRLQELAVNGGRRGRGIVFLWAAGNENCLLDHVADQEVPYDHGVESQGNALVWVGVKTTRRFRNNLVGVPGVMHVAALASTTQRSHYSNYGPGIGVCAPSSNSHAYYRMTVRGLGITTATGEGGGATASFGGTSSATPLVAGVAALTVSANNALTALDVISILKQTAIRDLNLTPYPKTPPASFDEDTRWDVSPVAPFHDPSFVDRGDPEGPWSPWFGHGRVDAAAAVREALNRLARDPGTESITRVSSPDKSIPDNSTRGIRDALLVDTSFHVLDVSVNVDITHTYVGDLVVTLTSPAGTSATLHARAGGSSNDLHETYDVRSSPHLRAFEGEDAQGQWQLHVQDLAAQDRGRLKQWSLSLTGSRMGPVLVEETPGVIIPDNLSGGIERHLEVASTARVGDIEVFLDITHTYIGDLAVTLHSPDNVPVVLHQRTGGGSDNLIKQYTPANTPALQVLRGGNIGGRWRLHVADHARLDQGKLNRWGLRLTTS